MSAILSPALGRRPHQLWQLANCLVLLSRKTAASAGDFWLARRGSDWLTVEIRTFQEGWVDLDDDTGTQTRFAEYTASLASVLGHADRVRPFADYCVGLLSAE